MPKKTVVDIDKLKKVYDDLTALQSQMSHTDGALQRMGDVSTVKPGIGELLDGAGNTITQFTDARTNAIRSVYQRSSSGLGTVLGLLQTTITNYETNENAHRDAADATGNGGGGNGAGASGEKG